MKRIAREGSLFRRTIQSWLRLESSEGLSVSDRTSVPQQLFKRKDYGIKLRTTHGVEPRVPFSVRGLSQQEKEKPDSEQESGPIGLTTKVATSHLNDTSIEYMKRVNPEMAAIMEMHERLQRDAADNSIKSLVEEELQSAHGKKHVNITKTALMKLKVKGLRDILEISGSDSRGNKAALVSRILDDIRKEEENKSAAEVASNLGHGVAQRKQIMKFGKLKDIQSGAIQTPVTDEVLRQSQEEATLPRSIFSEVFSSPHEVAQLLVDARAGNVIIIDVRKQCSFTDYMIIASGRSHQMVYMLASAVLHELKKRCHEVAPGVAPSIEGRDDANPDWLVIDAGSVVVHVFHEDVRSEYDLESLWGDEESSNVTKVAIPYSEGTVTLNTIQ